MESLVFVDWDYVLSVIHYCTWWSTIGQHFLDFESKISYRYRFL